MEKQKVHTIHTVHCPKFLFGIALVPSHRWICGFIWKAIHSSSIPSSLVSTEFQVLRLLHFTNQAHSKGGQWGNWFPCLAAAGILSQKLCKIMKCTYIWGTKLRFEDEIQFQVEIPKCGDLQYELNIFTFLPLIEVQLTANKIN